MAKVTEVETRMGKTVNLGNYESLRLDYSARTVLAEDEDAIPMLHSLRKVLKAELKKAVKDELNDKGW